RVALRILTDGAPAVRAGIVGLALSTAPHRARYVPLGHHGFSGGSSLRLDEALSVLRPLLEDPAIEKIGHDLKVDMVVLRRHGVHLAGLAVDTMIVSYLLDATHPWPLEETSLEHLGYKALLEEDVCGRGVKALTFADTPPEGTLDYAGERAD